MGIEKDRLEVDRLRNLVDSFGWNVIKEEITELNIILTVQKSREEPLAGVSPGPS